MGLSTRTLFVGNLPGYIRQREVEDLFCKFGPIVELDLKIPPRPPAFAFVEFEDARDAQDAIRERDGYKFNGRHIRVKLAHGGRGSSSVDRYSSGGSRAGITRHTDFRVHVTGLPPSASWQDLKDHMRQGGDVCYSQVFRDRAGVRGVVDYTNYDDMKHAIRKLDDSLFFNMFAKAYIRSMNKGTDFLETEHEVKLKAIAMIAGVTLPGKEIPAVLDPDLFLHWPVPSHHLPLLQDVEQGHDGKLCVLES